METNIKLDNPTIKEEDKMWLKKNFMFHSEHILKFMENKSDEEKKDYLWRLVKDSYHYSYAKGYNVGVQTGIAKGAVMASK